MKRRDNNILFIIAIAFVVVIIILLYYASLGKINWLNSSENKEPFDEEKRNLAEEIKYINNRLEKLEKHIAKKIDLKIRLDKYVKITYSIIKCLLSAIIVGVQILFMYWCNDSNWHTILNDVMNINEAIILFMATASLIIYGKPLTILNVFSLFHTNIKYLITSKFEHHLDSKNIHKEELINLEAKKKEKSERLRTLSQNGKTTEQEKIN